MFIAHLPAGYIASSLLFARGAWGSVARRRFLWAGMLGAVAPDIDLLCFYLVDHRRHPHHAYLTHYPLVAPSPPQAPTGAGGTTILCG